jgi:hypothetical protein
LFPTVEGRGCRPGTNMYVELFPCGADLEVCCTPSLSVLRRAEPREARLVVLFTTPGDTRAVLKFAQLFLGAQTRFWVVCPTTPTLLGRLRLERFVRFAATCANSSTGNIRDRLRFIAAPCSPLRDPAEDFVDARSVAVIRTRWWRPWGRRRAMPGATVFTGADGLSIIL